MRRFRIDRGRYGRYAVRVFLKYGLFPLAAPMSLVNMGVLSQKRRAANVLDLPSYIPESLKSRILDMDSTMLSRRIGRNRIRSSPLRESLSCMLPTNLTVITQYPQPVEVCHPFLDRRMVEAALAMPQDMKWDHRESDVHLANRYHHRRALKGILPEQVRVGNRGVEFSAAINQSFSSAAVHRWFTDAPAIHIFERGYADPNKFMDTFHRTDDYMTSMFLSFMICMEGWLRALAVDGAFDRLIRPQRSRSNPGIPSPQPVSYRSSVACTI